MTGLAERDETAKAAFIAAQSVYRGDHDHFPLKSTWETTDERVRDGWRKIAAAVLAADGRRASEPPIHIISQAIAPYWREDSTAYEAAEAVAKAIAAWNKRAAS